MATNLVRDTKLCSSIIEARTGNGPGAHRRRAALKRDLWRLLETGELSDYLRRFASENHVTAFATVQRRITETNFALPRAVLEATKFGHTDREALNNSGAHVSELQVVRYLARMANGAFGTHARSVPASTAWVAETDESFVVVNVMLDARAAEDMLLPVIEAFLVPGGRGKPYTETYGICLGTHRRVRARFKATGELEEHFVHITRCVPQLRAKSRPTQVVPNDASFEASLKTADALFPHLEVVGDFHSHPRRSLSSPHGAWECSAQDESYNVEWYRRLLTRCHVPIVGIVVGIARATRRTKALPPRVHGLNTHQLSVAGCQVVIAAHRILSNGRYGRGITLNTTVNTVSLYD